MQQGERQLGAVEELWAGGGGGRGGGGWRSQLRWTGRVRGRRDEGQVEAEGVTAVWDHHRVGDVKALLPVGLEHVGEAEALTTHLAGVRLLSGVRAAVAFHVGPTREALPTDLTDVRLLS